MLPTLSSQTVDKLAGAEIIRNLYLNHRGQFDLGVRNRDGTNTVYRVHFTSADWSVLKRWKKEYWDISIEMEQI
jgi:hypothetical protein